MANIQSWALSWFNEARNQHMVEALTIVHAAGTLPLNGSVIEPGSTINKEGIRSQTDKTLFVFNTSDLSGLTLRRGDRISRSGVLYEVIIDKDTKLYYNDPNRLETVVTAKLICS